MGQNNMGQVTALPPLSMNGSTNPEVTNVNDGINEDDSDLFVFSVMRTKMEALINDWEHTREKAREHRKQRDVEVSVEVLRREGTLDEDETMVPVRTIDTNIIRELPPYVNYIKNSRRICIFTSVSIPNAPTDALELEFTRIMTYADWEKPLFKLVDGACTHGWDATEVVFDTSKPGNVSVEHIGFDCLYWPRTCMKLEQAKWLIRKYEYTSLELRSFVRKFDWDQEQVNKIIQARKGGKKEAETNHIYKILFKNEDGIVYSGWFCVSDGVDDWLKAPTQHYIGIDQQSEGVDENGQPTQQWEPIPLTEYPIELLPYRESEKPKLIDKRGRTFYDGPKQEAQTGILSSFINGLSRATKVMASPAQDDGTGNSVKAIEGHQIEGGVIYDHPINFFNQPYPDFQILKCLQWLDTSNQQETGQINYAVMNREDSRKTAKEMDLANQQNTMLNSVQLTLFSTYMRKTYSLCWLVVQSQALQDNINFLLINQPQPVQSLVAPGQPVAGQPVPPMRDNWVNNKQVIGLKYDVRAAGDVDVVQKQERIQQMKQDWQVYQNTPLANQFLMDLTRLEYPDKGEQYAQILQQGQQSEVKMLGGLCAGFTKVVEAMVKNHPELFKSLAPQEQLQLAQMLQQGGQVAQKIGEQK